MIFFKNKRVLGDKLKNNKCYYIEKIYNNNYLGKFVKKNLF